MRGEVGAQSAPGEGRHGALAALLLALLPLACSYSPTVEPQNLKCRDDNGCPSGFRCVGATDSLLGICCDQPDAAACLAAPDAAPAPGPEAGGNDVAPDSKSDRATDPRPGEPPPTPDGQPDLTADGSPDLATAPDAAPEVLAVDAGGDRPDAPAPDVPADVPITDDGGPDTLQDIGQDNVVMPPVDVPSGLDAEVTMDTSVDSATDEPLGTAPLIVSIEGTGQTAPIAPRTEDLAFWDAHASDRIAGANRISSTDPVLIVSGSNLDQVTLATLAGQSGQGNHQMSIEEKTMTNLKLRWPSTLTAGGLFVLSLAAATGTATAQVFFLQGEKGDPGDSVFTCTGDDCATTKNVSVNGLFTAAGGFTAGSVHVGPETTRTINVDSSMTADQIQAVIDGIGKYVPRGEAVTLQFADGTYALSHSLDLQGFYGGGRINVYGNPTQIATDALQTDLAVSLDFGAQDSHGVRILNNNIEVLIDGLKIRTRTDVADYYPVQADETLYVKVHNSFLLGSSTAHGFGIEAEAGAELAVFFTYMSNLYGGVRTGSGAFALSDTNGSVDPSPIHGLHATHGGVIAKNGSQPSGTEYVNAGGEIR